MTHTDTERLDFLIRNGDWSPPTEGWKGAWTSHDGRGCDNEITPPADDPREALDLALDREAAQGSPRSSANIPAVNVGLRSRS
jgi:hypothetical protein